MDIKGIEVENIELELQVQAWLTSINKIGVAITDYILVDFQTGNGVEINYWNEKILGLKPTKEQLNSVKAEALSLLYKRRINYLQVEIQRWMDKVAQKYNYNDILTAVSYKDDLLNPLWKKQGEAFVLWRSKVWEETYKLFSTIEKMPDVTAEYFTSLLPEPKIPLSI